MKRGIIVRAFGDSPDFLGESNLPDSLAGYATVFETARAFGFDGVQLYATLEADTFLSLRTERDTLKEIAGRAADNGVELPSLELAPLQYSLVADDEAERQRGEQVVQQALRVASDLGCRGVLVIPGAVGLPWVPGGGTVVNYAAAYDRAGKALARLAPIAEQCGVSIYIENIWNMFLLSPLEMRALLTDVNSDHVGLLLDTGNVTLTGFAEQWIEILGPLLREVHLKDFLRSVGTVEGMVPILAGDVNWPAVMEALAKVGFAGYLIPEAFPYRYFGKTLLTHLRATLDQLLSLDPARAQ